MLLAQELGVSLDWLVLGKNPSRLRSDSDGEERVLRENDAPAYAAGKPRPASLRHLPLLAWNALEEKTEEASVYYPCPLPCSQHSFALKIQGDSMFPAYRDGEIIYVDPEAAPEHNRDVVLRNAQGSVTFRRLQQAPDGPYLLAINPDQPERFIKMPDDGRILGVIIASYMER